MDLLLSYRSLWLTDWAILFYSVYLVPYIHIICKFCRFFLHGKGPGNAKEYTKHLLSTTPSASNIQHSTYTSSGTSGLRSDVCSVSIQLQLCPPATSLGLDLSHLNHTHQTFSKLSTHSLIIATSISLALESPQPLRRLKKWFFSLACFFPEATLLHNSINFHFPLQWTQVTFIPFQASHLLARLLLNENSWGGIAVWAPITDCLMVTASFIRFACLCPFPLLHSSTSLQQLNPEAFKLLPDNDL